MKLYKTQQEIKDAIQEYDESIKYYNEQKLVDPVQSDLWDVEIDHCKAMKKELFLMLD